MKYVVVALITLFSSAYAQSVLRFEVASSDIESATAEFDSAGRSIITIRLMPEAAQRFQRITCANVNQLLEFVVNDKVIVTATIASCVEDGAIQLSGNYTLEEARQLANSIKPGSVAANGVATNQALGARTNQLEQFWRWLALIIRFFTRVGVQWIY